MSITDVHHEKRGGDGNSCFQHFDYWIHNPSQKLLSAIRKYVSVHHKRKPTSRLVDACYRSSVADLFELADLHGCRRYKTSVGEVVNEKGEEFFPSEVMKSVFKNLHKTATYADVIDYLVDIMMRDTAIWSLGIKVIPKYVDENGRKGAYVCRAGVMDKPWIAKSCQAIIHPPGHKRTRNVSP